MPDSVNHQKSKSTSAQSPIRPDTLLYRLLQTIARAVAARLTDENSSRTPNAGELPDDVREPKALKGS